MAEAFAQLSDVEARWRPLTSEENLVASTLLADASDMIRERWSDVDSRVTSGALMASSLTRIVALMVKRAMQNPSADGVSQFSQAAGVFSQSATYANPDGSLFLRAADIALLDGLENVPKVRMGWLA